LISSIGEVRSGKRIGREGGCVLVSFQIKTQLALIACNPSTGHHQQRETGRSAGEAVHDTRACDKARSGQYRLYPAFPGCRGEFMGLHDN
jgi:hypothetical protein